ncbi:hypothetical protein HMPREF9056_01497 [Actinomyces sp. oral taxon 170 str. F0386]|nr:hypothetical protein HMPREF9056_01497 [Actinomyces sp. oral taxon 170 str. F0386]
MRREPMFLISQPHTLGEPEDWRTGLWVLLPMPDTSYQRRTPRVFRVC